MQHQREKRKQFVIIDAPPSHALLGFSFEALPPMVVAPFVPWGFLDPDPPNVSSTSPPKPPTHQNKMFMQAFHHACDIPLSQLLIPSIKEDSLMIAIP